MKTRAYLQIALILVTLLSSCGRNDAKIETQLQGKTWELSTYRDTQPIAGRHPILEFDVDQISGTTGCNHYGGTYQIEGDSIRFEEIFSTEMACLDPDGLMDQERTYLELLRVADRFELNDGVLTFYTEADPILVFEIQSNEPSSSEPTIEPENPVSEAFAPSPSSPTVFDPPEGFNKFQDPITRITIYIPETWIVTSIIEGQSAILQSYPEDKYIGGEMLAEGDTKCDLSIRSEGTLAEDLIQQWESDSMTMIVSKDDFDYPDGVTGQRFVIDSLGRATVFITEINQRVVLLTCFGDFSRINEIAATLKALE